jgi:hypothetical protein
MASLLPSTEALNARTNVTLLMSELHVARTEVADEFQRTGKFPAAHAVQPRAKHLKALRVEENGRIVGELSFPEVEGLDRKSISLEPRVESGRIVEWRCASEALPRYVPPSCR